MQFKNVGNEEDLAKDLYDARRKQSRVYTPEWENLPRNQQLDLVDAVRELMERMSAVAS